MDEVVFRRRFGKGFTKTALCLPNADIPHLCADSSFRFRFDSHSDRFGTKSNTLVAALISILSLIISESTSELAFQLQQCHLQIKRLGLNNIEPVSYGSSRSIGFHRSLLLSHSELQARNLQHKLQQCLLLSIFLRLASETNKEAQGCSAFAEETASGRASSPQHHCIGNNPFSQTTQTSFQLGKCLSNRSFCHF